MGVLVSMFFEKGELMKLWYKEVNEKEEGEEVVRLYRRGSEGEVRDSEIVGVNGYYCLN